MRRRRNSPAPIKSPASALVGSGTAVQLRVLPDKVKEPPTGLMEVKLLFTTETDEPKAVAQLLTAVVPFVVKI